MSKKLFYQEKLQKFQHHALQTWSIIKSLIPSSSSSSTLLGKIKDGENVLSNAYDITETFNDYFLNIGQKLADKIISTDKNAFRNYLSPSVLSFLFFNPTSPFEVKKQIQLLKNRKSCGRYNNSAYFIKVAADILAVPLTALFSFSLRNDIFPDCLKTVKIIPIF